MKTVEAPRQAGPAPAGRSGARRIAVGPAILIGIVAVGLTLTIGELLAAVGAWMGLLDPAASPFGSLGAAFISVTPEWLKDVGITLFGQSDKAALAVTMIVTFAVVGLVVGTVGRINAWAGAGVGAAMVVVTGVAEFTRSDARGADLLPILIGAWAGIGYLLHAMRAAPDPYVEIHAAAAEAPDDEVTVSGRFDRRHALRAAGYGAVAAAVAGGLSRLVPGVVDVQANRADVRLPPVAGRGAGAAAPGTAAGGIAPTDRPAITGTGNAAGAGRATGSLGSLPPLPADVNPAVPNLTPYVTPDSSFYRVDTAFTVPRVTTAAWRLKVHGLVEHPFEITWQQLLSMPQIERWITLACVSNEVGGDLVGNAAWQGVRISDILNRAKPRAGADCVYSTSADNFTVTTPLDVLTDGRDAMLAIGMNGQPLPVQHGFPVRMVVPGLYGYVSATKWVVDMEVTRFSDAAAYWTERGWAPRGPVKTSSRIDTPGYDVTVRSAIVPVAGVAWAQHRGISAVQVQVDDGPWQDATLAGAASKDTWRQWVYRWHTTAVKPGKHTLRCRAVDGTGAVQDGTPAPVAPNGATGYDEVSVIVA